MCLVSLDFAWSGSLAKDGAGILLEQLLIVIGAHESGSSASKDQIGQEKQITPFGVLPEIVSGQSRNVVADQPGTHAARFVDAKERVERRGLPIIGHRDARASGTSGAVTAAAEVAGLDARQIRLEGHARVIEPWPGHWTGKL